MLPDPLSDDDTGGSGTIAGAELCSSEFSDEEACDCPCADEAEELVFEALVPDKSPTAELDACEASEEPLAEKICTVLFSFCAQPESTVSDKKIAIMSFLLILNISPK